MSVKIRLQRLGGTHRPFYHIVATNSRSANGGRFIEKVGHYDPLSKPTTTIAIKEDRVQYWFERGAELSGTVAKLLKVKKIAVTRTPTAKV